MTPVSRTGQDSAPPPWPAPTPAPVAPLVDAAWLVDHREQVVIFEVEEDSTSYYEGHIPGALALASYDDLHEQVRRGPLNLAHFKELMGAKGVRAGDHVVLYSPTTASSATSGHGVHAAFAYWVMHHHGHQRISLLDGGQDAWTAAGGQLVTAVPEVAQAAPYRVGDPRPWTVLARQEVLDHYVEGAPDHVLLDCRTPAEYEGRTHHQLDVAVEHHRMRGHIPGAVNLPSIEVLDGSMLRRPEELRELFAEHGVRPGSEVGVYCRVAERSALLWFALSEIAGHPRARHYVGGWAEYGSLIDVPVTRE